MRCASCAVKLEKESVRLLHFNIKTDDEASLLRFLYPPHPFAQSVKQIRSSWYTTEIDKLNNIKSWINNKKTSFSRKSHLTNDFFFYRRCSIGRRGLRADVTAAFIVGSSSFSSTLLFSYLLSVIGSVVFFFSSFEKLFLCDGCRDLGFIAF